MEAKSLTDREVQKARSKTIKVLNLIKKMFPKINRTRFHQLADFYTLTVLISRFESEGLVLNNIKRNTLAWDILVAFSTEVDIVREAQKKADPMPGKDLYKDYLLTVQSATDEIGQRRKREQILRGLLESLFQQKDFKRIFSQEQRRIIWNTSDSLKCKKCHKILSWNDFTIDHISPYTKGGKTKLENAALMCRSCNSKKGSK
jgi:5-methylcytosine-specific restriction endonuclease McrA